MTSFAFLPAAASRPIVVPRTLVHVIALACAAIVATSGCPGSSTGGGPGPMRSLPLITTDNPRAEADMRSAREAAERGNGAEAARRYEAFLREYPNDPLVVLAKLGLGQIRLAEGNVPAALPLFDEVAAHPDASVAERGRFYRGVALHLAGQHRDSLDTLRPFVGRTVDPAETALLMRTIAGASIELGDQVSALEALDALCRETVPEDERQDARRRIETIATRNASAQEIARAYDSLPHDGVAWPLVAQRAMRDAYAANDMQRLRTISEALRAQGITLSEDLQELALRAARPHEADTRAIGAILPLTGRGREIGQIALRGLMLASGTPANGPVAADAPQLVFRDDAGDATRAVRAVEDLVSLHRVIAIVGPIDSQASLAAARRAQELGVPMITLTPAEAVTRTGPMVFRLFVSPAAEASALVAHARARGAQRFAVLHPNSPFGNTMREAFESAVRDSHGEMAGAQAYAADATSFGREITALRAQRFDALFVPDTAQRLSLIAPALAAAGIWSTTATAHAPGSGRAIVLLAPSVGFDQSLSTSSGRYLQGATFSVPFFAPTATGAARQFADSFTQQFGAAPNVFAASAYDAYKLVRRAVEAGAVDRAEVGRRLATMRGVDTAGPSGGFGNAREAARGTRLLELRGNLFLPPEPAAAR